MAYSVVVVAAVSNEPSRAPGESDALWEQASRLRPALNNGVVFTAHRYRGRDWIIVQDSISGQHYRLNAPAYELVRGFDGLTNVGRLYVGLTNEQRHSLTTTDVVALLSALDAAELTRPVKPELAQGEAHTRAIRAPKPLLSALLRPLMIRVALLDPDRLLGRMSCHMSVVFSRVSVWAGALLVCWAALQVIQQWPLLSAYFDARFVDAANIGLLLVLYPLVKLLHELAHGVAVKYWGGEVHEAGVMFLVFVPIPYVDASASTAFSDKYRRMWVAGAGVAAELLISALALLVWMTVGDGLLRDVAFDVMVLAAASTLLFNGNPLLRFDGYYLLSDALEIPNLSSRASAYLQYLFKRFALGVSSLREPPMESSERGWLLCYGLAAGVYRLLLSIAIAVYVASRFFIAGVVLAVWMLVFQWLLPAVRGMWRVWSPAQPSLRAKIALRIAFTGVVLSLLLFVIPVNHSTFAMGVIRPSMDSFIRAPADGFVEQVWVEQGSFVEAEQPLFRIENGELVRDLDKTKAQLLELRARQRVSLLNDPVESARFGDDIRSLEYEIRSLEHQQAQLVVRSPVSGQLSATMTQDMLGRYYSQGQVIGYVHQEGNLQARVVVDQADAFELRHNLQAIDARLLSAPGRPLAGSVVSAVPLASDELPSAVLGSQGGGAVSVDARDERGTKAMHRVFHFDIQLTSVAADSDVGVGGQVAVKFIRPSEPIGIRWWRALEQYWLANIKI